MKTILSLFLMLFTTIGFAQKSHVYCPEIDVEQRQQLEYNDISIVIKDARTYDKKLKEKCTKDVIFSEFINCIKRSFPNIKINTIAESEYDKDPADGTITFKISFKKYDATYHPGVIISETKFNVEMFDYRTEKRTLVEQFEGEKKHPVLPKHGQMGSNQSFKRAFDKFIIGFESFINNK